MKLKKDKEEEQKQEMSNSTISKPSNATHNAKVEYGEFYNKNIIYKRNDGSTLTLVYDSKSTEYISRKLSS
jgi:hypothetical protein